MNGVTIGGRSISNYPDNIGRYGKLWGLLNGNWSEVELPAECESAHPWHMAFYDNNFGVVSTETNRYFMFDGGNWTCNKLPVAPEYVDISFVHVHSPQQYYLGVNNHHATRIFRYVNGLQSEIQLPSMADSFYGIATIGNAAPTISRIDQFIRY